MRRQISRRCDEDLSPAVLPCCSPAAPAISRQCIAGCCGIPRGSFGSICDCQGPLCPTAGHLRRRLGFDGRRRRPALAGRHQSSFKAVLQRVSAMPAVRGPCGEPGTRWHACASAVGPAPDGPHPHHVRLHCRIHHGKTHWFVNGRPGSEGAQHPHRHRERSNDPVFIYRCAFQRQQQPLTLPSPRCCGRLPSHLEPHSVERWQRHPLRCIPRPHTRRAGR
mmetsp:Transcript_3123/g.7846  ORF Transcript_3123/g.7846 Transcript_3123/m.7846 type:complete len:221 (+) Transcript_3123:118-780(+)